MKINRSFVLLAILAGTSVFAQRYIEYQNGSCPSGECPYGSRNYPRTAEVYRPLSTQQPGRVPLDYEGNELSKRLPTEHFTFDPEEAGLTRR